MIRSANTTMLMTVPVLDTEYELVYVIVGLVTMCGQNVKAGVDRG